MTLLELLTFNLYRRTVGNVHCPDCQSPLVGGIGEDDDETIYFIYCSGCPVKIYNPPASFWEGIHANLKDAR